ncbi:hypothetical protein AAFF_G00116050 [Aldrovandia affinis]|uniref:Uncharacterized protein n=1 Tax=Aldrovandia affinis TaxID=143900 RepID=A0AAD7T1G6_9TELE|nr:hypothetical protein AAFF_G00116050 [Aldrovandia affinis]
MTDGRITQRHRDHACNSSSIDLATVGKPEESSLLDACPSVVRPEGLVINLRRTRVIHGSAPLLRPFGPLPTRVGRRD